MGDANEIAVSYDEMRAVRVRDGARLEAAFGGGCYNCAAQSYPEMGGCAADIARGTRHCYRHCRKDGRLINWALADQ